MDDDTIMNVAFIFYGIALFLLILPISFAVMFYISRHFVVRSDARKRKQMSNDTKESPNLKCTSCGVPWADHMGIIGTCTENIKLRKENDALLFVVAKLEKESKEWNLRLQDPEPIQVLSVNTKMTKLRDERDTARRMYCVMAANVMYRSENKSTAEHIANEKNWNCYKKDETK